MKAGAVFDPVHSQPASLWSLKPIFLLKPKGCPADFSCKQTQPLFTYSVSHQNTLCVFLTNLCNAFPLAKKHLQS